MNADPDAAKWGVSAHLDSSSSSDSDGSTDLRALPAGAYSERAAKKAWGGGHLEQAHAAAFDKEGEGETLKSGFQNTVVGEG